VTAIVWDKVGDRRYETGVDRGVLYLTDGTAVPWNGLTSIVENRTRDVKSYYMDGVKYQDHVVPGDYAAKLQAFTYPDELDLLLGNKNFAPGVTVYDQPSQPFHLSYRTRIGNDLAGSDFAYRVHVVYNVVAAPNDVSYDTEGESVSAKPFEWDLRGTPYQHSGFRPTSHISLDSRSMDPALLSELEDRLYGSSIANPSLPSFASLLFMVTP
jgi:hypothetical protein